MLVAAGQHGRQLHKSTTFDVVVGVGLVTYGIVHLLIAWIAPGLCVSAARVALAGHAARKRLLRLLNLSPAGGVLLVLKAVGIALFGVHCFAWAANRRR